jgi:NAD-dependent histone deacetylase SIR2
MLRALDNARTLVRLYTQNIDGLEGKAGFDLLDQSSKARCITLHGSLMDLRCNNCSSVISMESAFHILKSGVLPTCSNTERGLGNLRKRTGNCGVLYPDIVLYGEPVKDEEYITAAANHDLRRISKNTLILVVGTSLKIPGIIAMIRKFSSTAKSKGGEIVYIDADPNIPENLHQCFGMIVKMDCQIFAQEVISGLNSKGVDELKEVEIRKDMRPLWDWDYV